MVSSDPPVTRRVSCRLGVIMPTVKAITAANAATPMRSPALATLLDEHRQEVARLRAGREDPAASFDAFVREHFDQYALTLAYDAMLWYPGVWHDDDNDDERGLDG